MKVAIIALVVWVAGSFATAAASSSSDFQAASDQASQNARTNAGHDYDDKVCPMIIKAVQDAIQECLVGPHVEADFGIVFFISAKGQVQRVVSSSNEPIVSCAVKKIHLPAALPRPPRDSWAVQIRMAFDYWQSAPPAKRSR
jgi:hypothetical protein